MNLLSGHQGGDRDEIDRIQLQLRSQEVCRPGSNKVLRASVIGGMNIAADIPASPVCFPVHLLSVIVVVLQHFSDIIPGCLEGGDIPVFSHLAASRIVSGKGQPHVPVELDEEFFEVRDPRIHVMFRVEAVLDTEGFSGPGHQLHKTSGPFFGNRPGIVSGFGHDDGLD